MSGERPTRRRFHCRVRVEHRVGAVVRPGGCGELAVVRGFRSHLRRRRRERRRGARLACLTAAVVFLPPDNMNINIWGTRVCIFVRVRVLLYVFFYSLEFFIFLFLLREELQSFSMISRMFLYIPRVAFEGVIAHLHACRRRVSSFIFKCVYVRLLSSLLALLARVLFFLLLLLSSRGRVVFITVLLGECVISNRR